MHKFDKETLDKTCASLVPCCDLQEISIEKYKYLKKECKG